MTSISAVLGDSFVTHPLKDAFLKWQCRVRQIMMRDNLGRPDDAITPEVFLDNNTQSLGHVITIMNKAPAYSVTQDLQHMYRKTHDPAHKRSQALQYFSATFYQKHQEFSDLLTATFPPNSPGAAKIIAAETCTLVFEAYAQRFVLKCKAYDLPHHHPIFQATMAHNKLFNPTLHPESIVLGFEADWDMSESSNP